MTITHWKNGGSGITRLEGAEIEAAEMAMAETKIQTIRLVKCDYRAEAGLFKNSTQLCFIGKAHDLSDFWAVYRRIASELKVY